MSEKITKKDIPEINAIKGEAGSAERRDYAVSVGSAAPNSPEGRPTKCLSFQEPFASFIVSGVKDAEFRSKKVNAPIRNLVVCASKTPRVNPSIPGLAYGFAIGMVDVVECVGVDGDHVWKLESPRLIKPFEVHATAGFFYVADVPEVIPNNADSYREYVLPHCFRGASGDEEAIIAALFSHDPHGLRKKYRVDQDRFDLARKRYPYNK